MINNKDLTVIIIDEQSAKMGFLVQVGGKLVFNCTHETKLANGLDSAYEAHKEKVEAGVKPIAESYPTIHLTHIAEHNSKFAYAAEIEALRKKASELAKHKYFDSSICYALNADQVGSLHQQAIDMLQTNINDKKKEMKAVCDITYEEFFAE